MTRSYLDAPIPSSIVPVKLNDLPVNNSTDANGACTAMCGVTKQLKLLNNI